MNELVNEPVNNVAKKNLFTRTLFRWHKTNYRDMPWRDTSDAYHILISEIMLQQTQVARVRIKYDEFLNKFPTVRHLARAPLGDVLRLWSGLGYNRRAKYLHECAKLVVANYGGTFPDDFHTLLTLPGIGRSTAAALLSFAFGKDEPMIDTNIRRILTRIFFPSPPPMSSPRLDIGGGEEVGRAAAAIRPSGVVGVGDRGDRALYAFAKTLIPKGEGRMWNYAMLDLGATMCTARNHADACPLTPLHGVVGDFVYKKPQKKFAHSNRFYRGRILSILAKDEHATVQKLAKKLALKVGEVRVLALKLNEEKMVVLRGQKLTLP